MIRKFCITAAAAAAAIAPARIGADPLITEFTNNYGTPGQLLDMPTAEMAPDGQLATTFNYFDGFSKSTLTFQILPRLTGSFRYSGTDNLTPAFSTFYDRSFDLRFRLLDETAYSPAVAVGLQDFIGTGLLGAEYLVATKSLGRRLRLTGGIGWGRLGSYNGLGSTGSRPAFNPNSLGGDFTADMWFRGDYALFGGASFNVTDKLVFSAEYSSDAYDQEVSVGIFERKSPWNFGVSYEVLDDVFLSAYSLHGSEIGARLNLSLNPGNAPAPGGTELAPLPVRVRPDGSAADLGWTLESGQETQVAQSVAQGLDGQGIDLEGLRVVGRAAHVTIRNETYDIGSQALGRTLRVLSRTLPDPVETLNVTLVRKGMPASTLVFSRTDLEQLEHAPAQNALAAARFRDSLSFAALPDRMPGTYPRFTWSAGPYVRTSLFDPADPVRADAGIRVSGQYDFGAGWFANGQLAQKVTGDLSGANKTNNSVLPRVRTDVPFYAQTDEPTLERLTLAKYGRPGPNLYSRVTVGYLEWMYAGASAELLWKPVDSRLALGVEANYVEPRDFDQQFGLRSRATLGGTIPRFNGHGSVYYDLGYGFHTQLDVGRYLAGDWGATVALDREFANGWEIGAFLTKTDVSAQQFGEGSFDKGIRISMPLSWLTGKPTQKSAGTTLRPLIRDGGARLGVEGRLYETVRDAHRPEIAKSWDKFWR